MRRSLFAVFAVIGACGGSSSTPTIHHAAPQQQQATSSSSSMSGAPTPDAPFLREKPEAFDRRSVDACAYAGGYGFACIDAMMIEPDPIRVRYMRRLNDAQVVLSSKADGGGAPAHAELVECCNPIGAACGATKKAGHVDCPHMDDGYACLTAAEIKLTSSKTAKEARALHERACRCDWKRAQIPVMGGQLACDGENKPVNRRTALAALASSSSSSKLEEEEARDVIACGTCDAKTGPAACKAEMSRFRATDPELAHYIDRVHVTRCQVAR